MQSRGIKTVGLLLLVASFFNQSSAQESTNKNKFRQLKQELATPNVYRTAAGAPGHEYYQNRADYNMEVVLDDEKQSIQGFGTVTYYNASPDKLDYLWLQLDQNMRSPNSDTYKVETNDINSISFKKMKHDFDGGFKIESVKKDGKDLNYTINKTMMRIDLEEPLEPGASISFSMKWNYNINDRMAIGGRSGYEYFKEEDNYIYTIAQFFPRMCVYNDVEGWQNKQFLGGGEFTLPFGDYEVKITVPSDHVVAATGVLSNIDEVLTSTQKKRLEEAKKAEKEPVFIVNQKEAEKAEKSKAKDTKTWLFKAQNVRDFAWASSRKFIWDAMLVKQEHKDVLAMSFYPKEGNPLWEQYSTKVVAHTLRSYSSHTFDYPYPVAISVHTKWIGMEYPMICFNGGRPEADGTYSERAKTGMISVIIHEVGHNYFPMIVNSDERQWTWMDEGLNTFLQYLAEKEWDRDYPSRRGPAYKIVDYMKGDVSNISPIMTNSESLLQFGNNAYGKPATALNILRETVMGRELFDYAFKTYANRWKFKHPTPEDFFRTMEDASAVDLDWFWRGWFYTTDHVDIAIDKVRWLKLTTKNPKIENKIKEDEAKRIAELDISNQRNKEAIPQTAVEKDKGLEDFYTTYNPFETTPEQEENYKHYLRHQSKYKKEIIEKDLNFYEVHFSNIGGLVMPIIIEFTFEDGTKEIQRIPAEIWRKNNYKVTKVFFFEKKVKQITLDPYLETADTDTYNNNYPRKMVPTRFEQHKKPYWRTHGGGSNPMKEAKKK